MQVRKFESKSMKEALEMVKNQLGPDAIILSVKDRRRGFGLAGETSFEVTAAVSDVTLRKKKLAESKLNDRDKSKFTQSSARRQKEFIDNVMKKVEVKMAIPRVEITKTPYIDIEDDEGGGANQSANSNVQRKNFEEKTASAEMRIKSAAAEAYKAINVVEDVPVDLPVKTNQIKETQHIAALRREITQLKSLIADFQRVPQSFISMHPGANEGIPYEMSFMYEKLMRAGMESSIVIDILEKAKSALSLQQLKKQAIVDAWVARHILDNIETAQNRSANRYHVFIGPSGHGKTSTLVKMASHFVITEKKKIGIVTTDASKVGASEQLRIFAKILNVQFAVVRHPNDWNSIDHQLHGCSHIFVDFPGNGAKTIGEVDTLRSFLPPMTGGRSIHFLMSVLSKDSDACEMAGRYKAVGFDDVIFTKLDESMQHGLIYNFQKKFNVPLHSFGIGPSIPEDFEAATKERVIDLLFRLTKLNKERG